MSQAASTTDDGAPAPVRARPVLGFVGLGSMGASMARNLLAAGYAVQGYDIMEKARPQFERLGGTWCASPASLDVDVLLLMVVNAAQAEDVLFASDALSGLAPAGTCILMSTCRPAEVVALAERVTATGRHFVDAPVSGGAVGAEAGSLTIMAAAAPDVFESVRPVLETVGSRVYRVGSVPGQGATVKAINQLLCGVHLAAAAEAVALGQNAGVDQSTLVEILAGSAASSWMLRDRGQRMIGVEDRVTSTIDIFVKDLGIVMSTGASTKTPLPIAAIAHQLFLAVSAQGKGALDDSQVIQAYQRLVQA